MNTTIASFLARHNFVNHTDVAAVADSILDDMRNGLYGLKSNQDMIRTYCLPPKEMARNQ